MGEYATCSDIGPPEKGGQGDLSVPYAGYTAMSAYYQKSTQIAPPQRENNRRYCRRDYLTFS